MAKVGLGLPETVVLPRRTYMDLVGFLNMLAQGVVPPNVAQQAEDLATKIGEALGGE